MYNFIKDIKLVFINKKIIGISAFVIVMVCALICTHHNVKKEENKTTYNIGIINEESSQYADILIEFFQTNESFKNLANVIEGDSRTIKADFEAGNIDAYMVIPKDFVDSLMYLEPIGITVAMNASNEIEATVLKSILKSYEKFVLAVQFNASGLFDICSDSGLSRKANKKMNMLVTMNLIKQALAKESFFKYNEVEKNSVDVIEHYIYVFVFITLLYMSIYAGIIVKREQYSGVLDLYTVNGGRKIIYVVSKAICIMIMYLLALAVIGVVSKITGIFQVHLEAYIYLMMISMILNILCIIFSLKIKSINIYTMMFNIAALLMIVIGGGIIPRAYLPDNFAILAEYLPYNLFEELICKYMFFSI